MKYKKESTSIQSNAIAGDSQFEIHSIDWLKENSEYLNDVAQRNDHFQIIWIIQGAGNFYIDLQCYNFEDSQLFFIRPGQVHRVESTSEIKGYAISFTELFFGMDDSYTDTPYATSILQIFTNANGTQIGHEPALELTDLTERMMKEINNLHLFREEILRRYFKIFLILLSREMGRVLQITSQTRNIELVQKFMSLLDKHFKTEKMVCGYAGMLAVTPNYLNEIIKKTTGFSAGYHIRQRIVLEAKRQATYSDNCMKQIGYHLGFNDMGHFSKFFKTAAGMNFTDFKKEKMVISIAS